MAKTKIDWCDYTVNPIKGVCPVGCSYCYAIAMYHRFGWDPTLRFVGTIDLARMMNKLPTNKPSLVFVGSTIDMFHDRIDKNWMDIILHACKMWGEKYGHTFIFLTKCPENLIKWDPFPNNCWIGVSATNQFMYNEALIFLDKLEATVIKFISFEPLQSQISFTPIHDIP